MSIRDATRLAPRAIFVRGRHESYTEYSAAAREIVERYSPLVRAASIDEHYIDFHGCERLYHRGGDADPDATILRVVCEITDAIDSELALPASAGIATSKPMAKVASGLAKPRGVLLVAAGSEAATLAPLPVRKLPGIGPVAESKLGARGITTLGELVAAPDEALRPIFGRCTGEIRATARGLGATQLGRERPAFREHDPLGERVGSISNERTFVERSSADSDVVLSGLCERVAWRARKRGVRARTITLKMRYVDFETISRSCTVMPTHCDVDIHRAVFDLYRRARVRNLAIRLLGVALSKLEIDGAQLQLFERSGRRSLAIDRVREKFGYDALHVASTSPNVKKRLRSEPA
jgi:DNA polymerase-4